MREFHEKQMSLIERLPAGEVAWFLDSQQVRAAALIQSWWRRKRKRGERRPKMLRVLSVAFLAVFAEW